MDFEGAGRDATAPADGQGHGPGGSEPDPRNPPADAVSHPPQLGRLSLDDAVLILDDQQDQDDAADEGEVLLQTRENVVGELRPHSPVDQRRAEDGAEHIADTADHGPARRR